MDKLLAIIAMVLVLFIISMLFVMWGWSLFMVPVFGLAPLTLSQAFGFTLLAHTFGKTATNSK